ncbi:MAG: 5-formyltetrahydrofolate cyclo-ligase [Thaumarchaeota archaeon]|nr:5-formyltetrahydrofolate cyclo-ligase [Nitrososphaerota archaeon]
MSNTIEKARLRKQMLDARDELSLDFIKIASGRIRDNLRKIDFYRNAESTGIYYSIGSEVQTHDLIQEFFNQGKEFALPRVEKNDLVFKKISSLSDLEPGSFGVMEPKEKCETVKNLDVVLVPSIALTREGYRLGYGFGFYDRYLHGKKSKKIGMSYAKNVLKTFPHDNHDVKMNCLVTEDAVIHVK